MATKALSQSALRQGVQDFAAELERLAPKHYHLSASQLMRRLNTKRGRLQYARLLGVIVKEPFADQIPRLASRATRAYVALRWKDKLTLRREAVGTWQFSFVKGMANNFRDPEGISDQRALDFLELHGRFETNLGKFLFRAFHERICGDEKTSKAVADAIKRAKAAGVDLSDPTATGISVGLASIVAVAIAPLLPAALAVVAAPVLGGLALLLLQVGVKGFCDWTEQLDEPLRAAEEETEDKQPIP